MENRIDEIVTLEDGSKYMMLDQGNYAGKAYFLANKLDENDRLIHIIAIFCKEEEIFKPVEDKNLLRELEKYFASRAK